MLHRIMGLETEYGLQGARASGEPLAAEDVGAALLRPLKQSRDMTHSLFLENGARVYLDVGAHPEWCTPECTSWRDVLAADRAGQEILSELALQAEATLSVREDEQIRVHLLKNNRDMLTSTFGCHENYLVPRKVPLDLLVPVLASFLATRSLVCGAGAVVPYGDSSRFEISARASHMMTLSSQSTTRDRPLVNLKDEPHADATLYRRLHLIVGDSCLADTSTALKLGTTSLVLRLLEELRTSWQTVFLRSPIAALRTVSGDPDLKAVLQLSGGGTITALQHQESLLERCTRLVDRHGGSDTDRETLLLWEEVLTDLAQDRSRLVDRVDWVRKLSILEGYKDRHSLEWSNPVLQRLDMAYANVVADRGLSTRFEEMVPTRKLVSLEQVSAARDFPPSNTRARLRSRFLTEAFKHGLRPTVDWQSFRLESGSPAPVVVKDPYCTEDERVDALIQRALPS